MSLSKEELKKLEIHQWDEIKDKDNIKEDTLDLFLGNGFSINFSDKFHYNSIFDKFIEGLTTPKDKIEKLFNEFNITNFEELMKFLDNALIINKTFSPCCKINDYISETINLLKEGLIKTIANIHPKHFDIENKIKSISSEIIFFNDIYTTNYDIILYYIILEANNKRKSYKDFFTTYKKDFLKFEPSLEDYEKLPKSIYYIHGSLHLFKYEQFILKLKIKKKYTTKYTTGKLLKKINKVIKDKNLLPVFVSEGDSNKKLETIYNNRYLNFCYDHLKRSKNDLLIFGSSLSNNDKHIIDAINYNKRNNIYYSIYISPENNLDDLREEIYKIKKLFNKNIKITFLDSSSVFKTFQSQNYNSVNLP